MNILVTGGLGYIGSHAAVELTNSGHSIVIVDNLSNSEPWVAEAIEKITGTAPKLYIGDIRDKELLRRIFAETKIDAVMHFAGLKSVPQSAAEPLSYYNVNLGGSENLCSCMDEAGCRKIIFSSSACVYAPISENRGLTEIDPLCPSNTYGRTKFMVEEMLRDLCDSNDEWSAVLLRYFNPIGAHESGLLGEIPGDRPTNLMPYITKVAAGRAEKLFVTGTDFDTPDGTGVRDYLHVVDLAKGHVAALDFLMYHSGSIAVNLGTGQGYSVLDIINSFEKVSGLTLPRENAPRRAGDLPRYYADPKKAKALFKWTAKESLDSMCASSWGFAKKYYGGEKA
ncbi:MAG: UDP-glucose 4-epimerase GalE [Oscillospiraceae bacterium]